MLFSQTLLLKLRGTVIEGEYDDLGAPVYSPDATETWPAWYEIMSSEEQTDARDRQEWGYTVYLPSEPRELAQALNLNRIVPAGEALAEAERLLARELRSHDTVVIDQVEYNVVGEPSLQPGGAIIPSYRRATVRRETG